MGEKQLDPRPFFVIGIIAVIAAGGYLIFDVGGEQANYYDFADCITDAGATKYGFDACPHCNKQKNIIGRDAFKQEIDDAGYYVRCRPEAEASKELGERAEYISSVEPLESGTTQGEACEVNVGSGTPTWVIDGERYVGEQELEDLAALTGCPLPENVE